MALDFLSWLDSGSPSSSKRSPKEGDYGGGFSTPEETAAYGFSDRQASRGYRTGDDSEKDGTVSYGGLGYGYSSGKTPGEIQEETQAQIGNTAANYGGRGKDMSRFGEKILKNIQDQMNANNDLYANSSRNLMRQTEWQPNQQREQSTLMALRNRMGNAAWGSSLVDLAEGLGRVDDMADVQLINTWKQNEDDLYNNWYQAYNDLISDYIDQSVSIEDEFSKLFSQYASTMSNLNPLLATYDAIKRSTQGESSSHGEGTDYYELPAIEGLTPTEALKALLEAPNRPSARNAKTYEYIRPDKGETSYNVNEKAGNANRHTAANKAFNDNLNAYRVRIKENPWDTE